MSLYAKWRAQIGQQYPELGPGTYAPIGVPAPQYGFEPCNDPDCQKQHHIEGCDDPECDGCTFVPGPTLVVGNVDGPFADWLRDNL